MNEKLLRDLTRRERNAYRRLCVARDDLEVLSDAIAVLLDPPLLLAGRRGRRPRAGRHSKLTTLLGTRKDINK